MELYILLGVRLFEQGEFRTPEYKVSNIMP